MSNSKKRRRPSPSKNSSHSNSGDGLERGGEHRSVKRRVGPKGGESFAPREGEKTTPPERDSGREPELFREAVFTAEVLSHAGAHGQLRDIADMASGAHVLDSADATSLKIDAIQLFAERLLVRGCLERALGAEARRILDKAPLISHFCMALTLAWQQTDAVCHGLERQRHVLSTSSSPSSSSSSASLSSTPGSSSGLSPWHALSVPPSSFVKSALPVPPLAQWILSHFMTYYREIHGPSVVLTSPAVHPTRSLIGTVTDPRSNKTFDVVICRDKSSALEGVSILLTEERSKPQATRRGPTPNSTEQNVNSAGKRHRQRKVGYLLAKIDNCGNLALRGVHIAEHSRGKGLSKLLLSTWLLLCHKLRITPCTCVMDKPLISLALQSLGFVPDRKTWQVEVQLPSRTGDREKEVATGSSDSGYRDKCGDDKDEGRKAHASVSPHLTSSSSQSLSDAGGKSVIWSRDLSRLRSIFSKRICQSQRIVITEKRPTHARTTYVRTAFSLPRGVEAGVAGTAGAPEHTFYSARILAFVSGIARVRRAVLKSM